MKPSLIIFLSIALFVASSWASIVEQPQEDTKPHKHEQKAVEVKSEGDQHTQHPEEHHHKKHHSHVAAKPHEGTEVRLASGDSEESVTNHQRHRVVKGRKGEHKSHRSRKISNRKHRRGQTAAEKQQRKSKKERQPGGKPKNRSHKRQHHH